MADHSKEVIEKQLSENGVKRDVDVKQLYLAKNDITECCDLKRFKNLQYLYLNGNKLRRIKFLQCNYRISELYLQENQLVEITGALKHLTCMEVLFLHNNQLTKLERVIAEFKKMQNLKSLNLFSNPIAQEQDYRHYVISKVPSLELLDRREILKSERDTARVVYDQDQEEIRERIAFGHRSEGPPSIYYPGSREEYTPTIPEQKEVGNNFYRNIPSYEEVEDAANARLMKKSLNQFSRFDWSKVPRAEERRTSDEPFGQPEVITLSFK